MQVSGPTVSRIETYLNGGFSIQRRRSVVTGNMVTSKLAPGVTGWRHSRSEVIRNVTITRSRPVTHIIIYVAKYTSNTRPSVLYQRIVERTSRKVTRVWAKI